MDSVGPSVAAQSKRPQDRRKRRELGGGGDTWVVLYIREDDCIR